MSNYVVVVADAARARIFSRTKKFSPLQEETVLTHPESRLQRQDLVSDRAGTVHESRTHGESQAEEPTDPKRHEAESFAREVANHLHQRRHNGGLEGLTLVAEPRFLGLLRSALDEATKKLVILEVRASLTRENAESIQSRIDA